jgi:hypothetical protein
VWLLLLLLLLLRSFVDQRDLRMVPQYRRGLRNRGMGVGIV